MGTFVNFVSILTLKMVTVKSPKSKIENSFFVQTVFSIPKKMKQFLNILYATTKLSAVFSKIMSF